MLEAVSANPTSGSGRYVTISYSVASITPNGSILTRSLDADVWLQ